MKLHSELNQSIIVIQCLDAQQQVEKHQIVCEIERLTNELEELPFSNATRNVRDLIIHTIESLEAKLVRNKSVH